MARYAFASDNVAGAMPEVIEALSAANTGAAAGYGEDHVARRAADMIRELLDTDAEVRFVASGTAANAISLAALAQGHEAVVCHEHSHVATDETGAPGFFGAGMGLITLAGESGRIAAPTLQGVLGRPDQPHWQSPAALSLTNATEYGAVYGGAEIAALVAAAKGAGLKVHPNAAAAGFDVKSIGRMGVDVAVLGGTKAGSTPTEAIVLFDKTLSRRFGARLKHGGQLVSKARFLAAPWIGMIETRAWTVRAAHANAMARRLAGLMPFQVIHPVEANAVFVDMDEPTLERLRAAGWFVYRFIDGTVRFMCSWATTEEAVDELGAALKAVV